MVLWLYIMYYNTLRYKIKNNRWLLEPITNVTLINNVSEPT